MMRIRPEEMQIIGSWREQDGRVVADEACQRIDELVSSGALRKVAQSEDGWRVLYEALDDGRLWELSYPHSEWQGGGPPALIQLSRDEAHDQYNFDV